MQCLGWGLRVVRRYLCGVDEAWHQELVEELTLDTDSDQEPACVPA